MSYFSFFITGFIASVIIHSKKVTDFTDTYNIWSLF